MCSVFPTEVSCNIPNIGAAGGEQTHNGLCVLTQNIINEKMYFIFWFWYALLGVISCFAIIWRILTIVSSDIRFALIYKTIRHQFDADLRNHLQSILDQGQIGDWFVLYQLSKNSNYYFYREFIRELSKDLKQKPKQSLSGSSGKGNQQAQDQQTRNNKVLSMLSLAQSTVSKKVSGGLSPQIGKMRMSMLSNTSQLPPAVNRNNSIISNDSQAHSIGSPRGLSIVSEDDHTVISLPTIPRDSTFSSTPPDSPSLPRNSLVPSTLADSPTVTRRSTNSSQNIQTNVSPRTSETHLKPTV